MNVLYDVSMLGNGFVNPLARTGIFRVVENCALRLTNSNECTLKFFVSSLRFLNESIDYLTDNSTLDDAMLLRLKNVSLSRHLYRRRKQKYLSLAQNADIRSRLDFLMSKIASRVADKILHIYPGYRVPRQTLDAIDIIHSTNYCLPPQLKRADKPTFYTIYDLVPLKFPEFLSKKYGRPIRHALKNIDDQSFYFSISQNTKDDFCDFQPRIDPSRVFVTPLAADSRFYPVTNAAYVQEIKKKYGIPVDGKYILSLNTIEPRKNIRNSLRAFADVVAQENIDDLYFVLVGNRGWKYDALFEEIARNPLLKQRVIMTGYVPDDDLAAVYSGALFFMYVSFYEGFGLPPLEAMQCGVPVIVSNTSSFPEIVGDAGCLVAPYDVTAISSAILSLYRNERLRADYRERGYERAREFSWDITSQKIISGYKTALADKK